MILDLAAAGAWVRESRYPARFWDVGDAVVGVFGADERTAAAVEKQTRVASWNFDKHSVRELHLRMPGQYALILRRGGETHVATDPYGIVKLYWVQKGGRSQLADDIYAFKGEAFGLDANALQYFLLRGYTPARHTFFREASKLEPCSVYRFKDGKLLDVGLYADVDSARVGRRELIERFEQLLSEDIDQCLAAGDVTLCLTGGVDSSLLYKLVRSRGHAARMKAVVGRTTGLKNTSPTDNDLDIAFAQRLVRDDGDEVSVVPYEISAPEVLDDFHWLRRNLFTEYAPAFAYVGLGRALPSDRTIINGQNADSVLSFGSMGSPRLGGRGIVGLHGFFSRYFQFYGSAFRASPVYAAASLLRRIYYLRHPSAAPQEFSDANMLLGLGLNPENKSFQPRDPAFANIADPAQLGAWFSENYVQPLRQAFPEAQPHTLAVLVYIKTYMQGSANRSTVLSSMLQGRKIRLPFTHLGLLELMCRVSPDWRYAFHGKYPNIALGSGTLRLPEYILERSDPVDSDSMQLTFSRLRENSRFGSFLEQTLSRMDLARYSGILGAPALDRLRAMQSGRPLTDISLLMRLAWLESTFAEFKVA